MEYGVRDIVTSCCERLMSAEARHMDYDAQKIAALNLYKTLRVISPPAFGYNSFSRMSPLPSGSAISPYLAAQCIVDAVRTSTYMRAAADAVRCVRERIPAGERVRILYAGTGPFAPHIIPLAMLYSPNDIAVTAVDIHHVSINVLKEVARVLDITDFFADFICADLTTYRHGGPPPHVILTETMSPCLLFEPQAAITRQLLPQLHADGVFVPARVSIDAFTHHCYDHAANLYVPVEELGTVCTFDTAHPHALPSCVDASFTRTRMDETITGISLTTRVHCFGGHILEPDASHITRTMLLPDLCCDTTDRVRIQYNFGSIKVSACAHDAQTEEEMTRSFFPLHSN